MLPEVLNSYWVIVSKLHPKNTDNEREIILMPPGHANMIGWHPWPGRQERANRGCGKQGQWAVLGEALLKGGANYTPVSWLCVLRVKKLCVLWGNWVTSLGWQRLRTADGSWRRWDEWAIWMENTSSEHESGLPAAKYRGGLWLLWWGESRCWC